MSPLVQGPDGALYGTTHIGGTDPIGNCGTVFKLVPGIGFTVLDDLGATKDGCQPAGGLTFGLDGMLYGMDYADIFCVAPDGTGYAVLHTFTSSPMDGQTPVGELIQGPDGTLYGTTSAGGANNFGTAFSIAADGSGFTLLHNFTTSEGRPGSGLLQGIDGTLYGTTSIDNTGVVFSLTADGSVFTVLHPFAADSDGYGPAAPLIQGLDGMLYGTSRYGGGPLNSGTAFRLAMDGSGFSVLHTFTGLAMDGGTPWGGLVQGSDGTLYGTTIAGGANNDGTAFQLAPDGSSFGLLYSFGSAAVDGLSPYAGLIQGVDGTLYGTTGLATPPFSDGTIFALIPSSSSSSFSFSFSANRR